MRLSKVESTLEDLKKETDADERSQTEDIPKVETLTTNHVNICESSDSVTFEAVAARKGVMKREEGALKNVTNADIAQNVATAEVTELMAKNTEAETKVEIVTTKVSLCAHIPRCNTICRQP